MIKHGLGWAPFWYEPTGAFDRHGMEEVRHIHMICSENTHYQNCYVAPDQVVEMDHPEPCTLIEMFFGPGPYPGDIDEHGEPL
jgi:hypothetical protein